MAWEIDYLMKYQLPGSAHSMAFDARDVWVTIQTPTGSPPEHIVVLGYWDQNSNYEGIYDEYFPLFYDSQAGYHTITSSRHPSLYKYAGIDLSSYLGVGEYVGQIVKADDKMYVAVLEDYDTPSVPVEYDRNRLVAFIVCDIQTKSYESRIELSIEDAREAIAYQNNKIWFTDLAQKGDNPADRQTLYYYNTTTQTFSSGVAIPARKQFAKRRMVNGRDTNFIISVANNNSIMKFNDSTGTFISETIVNRDPTAFYVKGDRTVLVGSADGMVTSYNQTTNAVSNDYGINIVPEKGMYFDGTYIWASAGAGMSRLDTTAVGSPLDNYRYLSNEAADYVISDDKFETTTFEQILVTPEINYQYWNGSSFDDRTVKPYLFMLSSGWLQAFRIMPFHRKNIIQVRCNAMIGTGPEKYYGETYE